MANKQATRPLSGKRSIRPRTWAIHQRRIAWGIGAGLGVVLVAMALLPTSRTAIDFLSVGKPAHEDPTASFRETRWYELGPKDWDPYKEARELRRNGGAYRDDDPRAVDLLKKLRDIWDNAPTNPALDGAAIRIPGYVVPLEHGKAGVTEFLLVPYFGACIHSPPPPSNQIVRVSASMPLPNLRSMDNVWVSGRLKAVRSDSSMGMSSYAMQLDTVAPYTLPSR
jgi:hypothetical protein